MPLKNVEIVVEGNIMTLKVDLSQDQGPSKSGKTRIVATTEGNHPLTEVPNVVVGLNVFSFLPKPEK